jgi:NADPH:quinone reductase-like Zn-dependent oxidoreductase
METRPNPTAGPGQVVVEMIASPINPSDLLTIRNQYGRQPQLPFVPGFEGVGKVISGRGIMAWRVLGKRVAVIAADGGAWQEQCVIPAIRAIPIPDSIPDDQAASFFVNPATAWAIVNNVLKIRRGEVVIQSAAAGAVGQMIQGLAKHIGFEVIHIVRRDEQAKCLKDLGAASVVVGQGDELVPALKNVLAGRHCRMGLDAIGGATGAAILKSLGRHGTLVSYGRLSGEPIPVDPGTLLDGMKSIQGFWLSEWMKDQNKLTLWRLFGKLAGLISRGILHSPTGSVFQAEEFREAVAEAGRLGKGGKVLIRFKA